MTCVCAPSIAAEMRDWVALGGTNSGCCGNAAHTYGFHRAGGEVPTSDYSRRHEPGRPFDLTWACAGDFAHNGNPALRERHAQVLARLMANDPALHMVCEFIGQPFSDKPVYYWARWNTDQSGRTILKRYTGSGHTTWSHISWWRSKANLRAFLFTGPAPTPVPEKTHPAYPGYVITFNPDKFDPNLRTWQNQMRNRGWRITVDGIYGPDTRRVVLAFQKEKKLGVDGEIGPVTWNAAWTARVT